MSDLFRRRYTIPPAVTVVRHQLVDEDVTQDAPLALWLMLNPSIANADRSDPTATKVAMFTTLLARHLGRPLRGWAIANLFVPVATKPKALPGLTEHVDPNGADAADHFRRLLDLAGPDGPVIFAWGSFGGFPKWFRSRAEARVMAMKRVLRDAGRASVYYLGRADDGNPRHPLMLAYETPFEVEHIPELAA